MAVVGEKEEGVSRLTFVGVTSACCPKRCDCGRESAASEGVTGAVPMMSGDEEEETVSVVDFVVPSGSSLSNSTSGCVSNTRTAPGRCTSDGFECKEASMLVIEC